MSEPIAWILLVTLSTISAVAQAREHNPFNSALLNHMVGDWTLKGTLNGQPTTQLLHAEWVLGHQFLRIDQRQIATTGFAFQAVFYIGFDPATKTETAHLLTIFGGGQSPVGRGEENGAELVLRFPLQGGEALYRFTWQPDSATWEMAVTAGGKPLLDLTAEPDPGPPAAH